MPTFIKSPFESLQDNLIDTILMNDTFIKEDKDHPNSPAKKWAEVLSNLIETCEESEEWFRTTQNKLRRYRGEMCLYCVRI